MEGIHKECQDLLAVAQSCNIANLAANAADGLLAKLAVKLKPEGINGSPRRTVATRWHRPPARWRARTLPRGASGWWRLSNLLLQLELTQTMLRALNRPQKSKGKTCSTSAVSVAAAVRQVKEDAAKVGLAFKSSVDKAVWHLLANEALSSADYVTVAQLCALTDPDGSLAAQHGTVGLWALPEEKATAQQQKWLSDYGGQDGFPDEARGVAGRGGVDYRGPSSVEAFRRA